MIVPTQNRHIAPTPPTHWTAAKLSVLIAALTSCIAWSTPARSAEAEISTAGVAKSKPSGRATSIQVYKSPTCGCCTKWEDHLKANGFAVKSQKTDQLQTIKAQNHVRPELSSCHTAVIDGYVIEGHVPAASIRKLLKTRPQGIVGLTVPGMPHGSPGMEGPITEKYTVFTFDPNGKTTPFDQY